MTEQEEIKRLEHLSFIHPADRTLGEQTELEGLIEKYGYI